MNTIKSKYENLILIGLIVVLFLHQINVIDRLIVVMLYVPLIVYYNPYKILTQIIHKTGLMSILSSLVVSISLSFLITLLYIGTTNSLYFMVFFVVNLSLGLFYLSKNNSFSYNHFLINILLTQIKYFMVS
jgi:hypothetical protein